jgi:hypothetical protein
MVLRCFAIEAFLGAMTRGPTFEEDLFERKKREENELVIMSSVKCRREGKDGWMGWWYFLEVCFDFLSEPWGMIAAGYDKVILLRGRRSFVW